MKKTMKIAQLLKSLSISFIMLSLPVLSADITQVHVDSGEVGQGFLVKRLNNCYLVSPEHVIGDAFFSSIKTGSKRRLLGEAEKIQTFGYDLSLSSVSGAASTKCITSINSFNAIDSLLNQTTAVSVSSVNADGSKSLTPANLIEVGIVYLSIQPKNSEMPFYKGLSGSLVYSGDKPLGLLQSVDAETGEGKVLRIDRLAETIRPFFSSGFTARSTNKQTENNSAMVKEKSVSIPYQLTQWSHKALNVSQRIANLSDGSAETHWAVQPNGVVSLSISLEGMKTINGLTLTAGDVDITALPKDFELLSNRREKGNRGWVSVYSGTWLNNKSLLDITIAPIKAKRLKVIFRSNWGNAEVLSFSELAFK